MKYTALVMNATIKNNFRWRIAAFIIFGIVFICVAGVAVLFIALFIKPEAKAASPDLSILENALGLILFMTSFCSVGIYSSVFAAQSLIREKTRGNIQALLATPVRPVDICLGKTLGVFLPGLMFGIPMTLVMFLLINYAYLIPVTGFVATPWMLVSSFIAVPLVFLSLTLLVHLIGMTGKAATGNVIAQVFLSVMPALMINLAIRELSSSGSWLFTVILLGIAGIIGIFALIIRPKLTTERIILSH